jgi:hypothetical protein
MDLIPHEFANAVLAHHRFVHERAEGKRAGVNLAGANLDGTEVLKADFADPILLNAVLPEGFRQKKKG